MKFEHKGGGYSINSTACDVLEHGDRYVLVLKEMRAIAEKDEELLALDLIDIHLEVLGQFLNDSRWIRKYVNGVTWPEGDE